MSAAVLDEEKNIQLHGKEVFVLWRSTGNPKHQTDMSEHKDKPMFFKLFFFGGGLLLSLFIYIPGLLSQWARSKRLCKHVVPCTSDLACTCVFAVWESVCLRSSSSFSKSLSKLVNPAPAQTSGSSQHGILKFEEAQLLIVRPKKGRKQHTRIHTYT